MILTSSFIRTPWGRMAATVSDCGLCALEFAETVDDALDSIGRRFRGDEIRIGESSLHVTLQEIFDGMHPGEAPDFSAIPLDLRGTPFRLRVWDALRRIPYGETVSYGDVASAVGCARGSQVVGTAVGANPVAVIVPCHRVIRADGSSGGYRWGEQLKLRLLNWEKGII